jgi:hypothetical protein
LTSKIRRNRAQVSPDVTNAFIDCLEEELKDVTAQNVWNYEETNLVDDLGRTRCFLRRAIKYAERVVNSSKTSFSPMFCGNSVG